MSEAVYQLARLRAERVLTLVGDERARVEQHAARVGRRLVQIPGADRGRRFVLDWQPGQGPASGDARYVTRTLTTIPLLTFACCLRLCWRDGDEHPFPGATTTESEVVELAGVISPGVTHIKSAVRHALPLAGLIEIAGDAVQLGPAVAVYTTAEVSALRRVLDRLPIPGPAV